jgi:hypothetical protein
MHRFLCGPCHIKYSKRIFLPQNFLFSSVLRPKVREEERFQSQYACTFVLLQYIKSRSKGKILTCWYVCNILHPYSGGTRSESRPENQLTEVFHFSSIQSSHTTTGMEPRLRHDSFLSILQLSYSSKLYGLGTDSVINLSIKNSMKMWELRFLTTGRYCTGSLLVEE